MTKSKKTKVADPVSMPIMHLALPRSIKMAKSKKTKVADPVSMPIMHLVLARAGMDDVPLLLTPSAVVAKAYTDRTDLGHDIRVGCNRMKTDASVWINITVVTFKDGRPIRMKIVREITESEMEIANGQKVDPDMKGMTKKKFKALANAQAGGRLD